MKSTQIHRTTVDDTTVSTVWVEGADYAYYETAIREANGKHSIEEWGMQLPIEAEAFHFATVEMVKKAQQLHVTGAGVLQYGVVAWTEIKTEDLP